MTAASKLKQIEEVDGDVSARSKRDQLADYFYRISNHEELFKIGKNFLQEAQKGVRNFAFTSTGYKNSQQRTILGLCCFFDQNADYKIAVISDHLTQGIFTELVNDSASKVFVGETITNSVRYRSFHHHFDFIDYSEFTKIYYDQEFVKTFEIEVKKILDNYDIILWDIPEMEKMKEHPHFHYRISTFYQSMNIIITQNTTSSKQVESVKNFFSNYNINLNGVMFDSTNPAEPAKKKKLFGIF